MIERIRMPAVESAGAEKGTEKIERSHDQMRGLISELAKTSQFTRDQLPDGREQISSPERGKYAIRYITDAKDPAIKKVHGAMVEEFGKEESETLTWLRHTVKKKINRYHIAETPEGDIATLSNTQYLELEPAKGHENEPKESIIPVWHIISDRAHRNKGIASELYQSFYQDALAEAQKRGNVIKGVIGEAVSSVEGFLNRMGRKRMYFEDKKGNMHEVPYLCPPVDMDDETGEPREEPMPEHVMLRLLDGEQKMPVEDLLRMVKAMYLEYVGAADNYDTKEAYQNSLGYNMQMIVNLAKTLKQSKDGTVFFMSRDEREVKRRTLEEGGKKLVEVVTEADEVGEGE